MSITQPSAQWYHIHSLMFPWAGRFPLDHWVGIYTWCDFVEVCRLNHRLFHQSSLQRKMADPDHLSSHFGFPIIKKKNTIQLTLDITLNWLSSLFTSWHTIFFHLHQADINTPLFHDLGHINYLEIMKQNEIKD